MSSKYSKTISFGKIRVALWVITLNILFFPSFVQYSLQGNNRFIVMMGDVCVGITDDSSRLMDYYREARRQIASESSERIYIEYPDFSIEGEEVLYGEIDSDEFIIQNIKNELEQKKVKTLEHAYSIKVNDAIMNLADADTVKGIFQDAINRYDKDGDFKVSLINDTERQLNVLNPLITKLDEDDSKTDLSLSAGFDHAFTYSEEELTLASKQGFDAYEYGITSMGFSETVEIVEAYMPAEEIMDASTVADLLLNEQETQQTYKVKSGDTLSEISMTTGLPLDEIIALNDELENENSLIHVDQELIITVPKPSMAVVWTERAKLEEAYNLPIEYIYNDDWYTNKSVTHQQPSAGYHEAILDIVHTGDGIDSKETVYEEVILEPVAKIVEVGTQVPPTYIKPLAGGRMTSTFGPRKSPTKGASSNHKGIDWATPIGTSIYASCGGTVKSAGWQSGYGYCVVINHPDGRQTRYGHLSKTLVSAGQSVKQGQIIAYSGNTGISTGPHVHFEILINGTQVNPLNYLY